MSDVFQQQMDAEKIPLILGLDEKAGYRALPMRNLRVGYEVPFDIFLKIKKKGEPIPSFVKGCPKGEIFHQDWYLQLEKLKIPNVYVSLQEIDLVMEYINHHLDLLIKDDHYNDLEKGTLVCDAAHLWMLHFFHREEARTGEQINQAIKFIDILFNTVKGDHHSLKCLLEVRRTGSHLFSHSLNVCLLGLAYTAFLGWDQEKIRWFGVGALLHDIGLIYTPLSILEKKGKLTPEEMNKIKRHPIDGFRMLQDFGYLRWEALQMIVQHHENGDGSGYPDGLVITEIKTWARILRILDCYEAMTAPRSWRQAIEPKEAIWTMRADWEKDKIFDRYYLETLIKFLAGQQAK
ncbi:MAG: HD-GYP domain-containing protein [Thermodesulfobacteriota bacterium]